MRLATLVFAALSGTRVAHGKLQNIDSYEILAAGDGSAGAPYGKVESVEPFLLKTYFEVSSVSSTKVQHELFANAAVGMPCINGTLLPNGTYTGVTANMSAAGYTKTTSDGVFRAAEYIIADVKTTAAYTDAGGNKGRLNLCARSSFKMPDKTEYISYVDTPLIIDVDFAAKFGNFTQNISIVSIADSPVTEENVTESVDVDAFVCAKGANASSAFKIGQDFSVCVRVSGDAKGYSVSNFGTIVCENSASKRYLFKNGVPDPLTSVITNGTDYFSKTGEPAGPTAKGFTSVITGGLFATGETSFSCRGAVSLAYNSSRRLQEVGSFHFVHKVEDETVPRKLQDLNAVTEGSFAVEVGIFDNRFDGLTAPAVILRAGLTPIITVGTAIFSVLLTAM